MFPAEGLFGHFSERLLYESLIDSAMDTSCPILRWGTSPFFVEGSRLLLLILRALRCTARNVPHEDERVLDLAFSSRRGVVGGTRLFFFRERDRDFAPFRAGLRFFSRWRLFVRIMDLPSPS